MAQRQMMNEDTMVCCEWRRVVESSVGRACATRRSLVDLGAPALLTDAVDMLALTV